MILEIIIFFFALTLCFSVYRVFIARERLQKYINIGVIFYDGRKLSVKCDDGDEIKRIQIEKSIYLGFNAKAMPCILPLLPSNRATGFPSKTFNK